MLLVKICKVMDIHTARRCGDLGVDFIGLHAIHSIDNETSARYASIVRELERGYPNTTPVLVTKVIDPNHLSQILTTTSISWVQLHVPLTRIQATHISITVAKRTGKNIKLIAMVAVNDSQATTRVLELAPIANCILLDSSYEGGTGIEADLATMRELVQLAFPTPVLIAGGITHRNAKFLLKATNANGIDVQSGVQIDKYDKNKDPLLIAELVSRVRGIQMDIKLGKHLARSRSQRLVSLAITSVDNDKLDATLLRFRDTLADLIHADFSDRTIAPRFEASPLSALARLRHLIPCMPYDVHLFVHDPTTQRGIIGACTQLNPLLRLVFLHVRGPSDVSESLFDSSANLCDELGLAFGLSIQATGYSAASLRRLLVMIRHYQCNELSLITHSRAHPLRVIIAHDLQLLKLLVSWSNTFAKVPTVSVDRDMTIKKLSVLSKGRPNHVIAGNSLLSSNNPYAVVENYKGLLSPLDLP